jgi:hypothetical protein
VWLVSAALAAQVAASPFIGHRQTRLEVGSLVTAFVTFQLGLVFLTNSVDGEAYTVLTIALVGANAVLILVFLTTILRQWLRDRDESRRFALDQLAKHDLLPEGEFDPQHVRKVAADDQAGQILAGTHGSSSSSSSSDASSEEGVAHGGAGFNGDAGTMDSGAETLDMIPHHPPLRSVGRAQMFGSRGRGSIATDNDSDDEGTALGNNRANTDNDSELGDRRTDYVSDRPRVKSRYGPRNSSDDSWDSQEHGVFANIIHRVAQTWDSDDGNE